VIDCEASFHHHFLEIAIAQSVPQIPAHAQQNDVRLEMTPLEETLTLVTHEKKPLNHLNIPEFIGLFLFLQHSRFLHNSTIVSAMDENRQKAVVLTTQPLQKSDGYPEFTRK
jgi:hypothetical protein